MNTVLSIAGDQFRLNDKLTYKNIEGCDHKYHGLLMNIRMIQGVFDDQQAPQRFNRFGRKFDAQTNTDELIASLGQWYAHGIRAITIGFQGGGPCFTMDNNTISNSPYREDGLTIDLSYLSRMEKIIRAADQIGMVVIVSLFYGAQTRFLKDDKAIMNAVKTVSNWLRENRFTNILIEIANEHNVCGFARHPILYTEVGIVQLIEIAKRESGGMLVGCSGTGGYFDESIASASDVILLHGNDQSRQQLYNLIQKAKKVNPSKPIVINEDSQAISHMAVAMREGVSWGYYNNMTKQEPPADWGITEGEDRFFALRIALNLGIETAIPPVEQQFYLQGLESAMVYRSRRWIRLASLYSEKIDYVQFFRNDRYVGSAYDDPFMLNSVGSNWLQDPFPGHILPGEQWKAIVTLRDGTIIEKRAVSPSDAC